MQRYSIDDMWSSDDKFGFAIDTLELSKKGVQSVASRSVPPSYGLGVLYQFITGEELVSAHQAVNDVEATCRILQHKPFWDVRQSCLFSVKNNNESRTTTAAVDMGFQVFDSDSSDGEEEDDVIINEPDDNEEESSSSDDEPIGDQWQKDKEYNPQEPTPMQLFHQEFTRRSKRIRTGLQCATGSVNSPLKAWKQIFTNSILDKIVTYTNDYGERMAKNWSSISRKDLIDFISVLFVASVASKTKR